MNYLKVYYLSFLLTISACYTVSAANEHAHKHTEPAAQHKDEKHEEEGEDHGKDEHEHDTHAKEEVVATNVGKGKGVLEASEAKGLKLTPEAIKTLGIETNIIASAASGLAVPRQALVESKKERFIFTLLDGFYKPLEVSLIQKNKETVQVKVSEKVPVHLTVVVKGANFLRNIQVYVFSGVEG